MKNSGLQCKNAYETHGGNQEYSLNKKSTLLTYTIIFIFLVLLIFFLFWSNGKAFIWNADGWTQHFKAFVYYGEWLKLLAENLFIHHKLDIPTFTFGLGYGSDLYTTLQFYAIGDPLNILAGLIPLKYQSFLYSLLVIVRLYLAGLAFIYYCFYFGANNKFAMLAGTYIYVFCGYSLFASIRHPFFINPMIYFPLLLLGVEKILKENKPLVFISAVFVSTISNFYFLYMLVFMTLLYTLLKIYLSEDSFKAALQSFFRISVYSSIGILLGSFILYPVVLRFLSDPRISNGYSYDGLLYPLKYYRSFLNFFSGYGSPGYWNVMSYGGVALLAVMIFIINWKGQNRLLKWYFLLLTLFLLFPFAGSALNGFSYVSNRWIWAYSFIVALVVVNNWHKLCLFSLEKKNKKKLIILSVLYIGFNLLFDNAFTKSGHFQLLIFLTLAFMIFFQDKFKLFYRYKTFNYIIFGMLLLSIIGNAFFLYSSYGYSYAKEFSHKFTNMDKQLKENEVRELHKILKKNEFCRFTASGPILTNNANILYGISSTQYFWSLSSGNIAKFNKEMSLFDNISYRLKTLDGRSYLNESASIKYYMAKDSDSLPFGYKLLKKNAFGNIGFYINKYALPLGYTYDTHIPWEQYNKLDSVKKQQAILQGVVLNSNKASENLKITSLRFEDKDIPYKLNYDKNSVVKMGNSFVVTKKNAAVDISFKGNSNCETYLFIKGLEFKGIPEIDLYEKYGKNSEFDPLNVFTKEQFDMFSAEKQRKLQLNGKYWTEPDFFNISLKSYAGKKAFPIKKLEYATSEYAWPSGRKDFIINTYYAQKPKTRLQIRFPHIGKYTFDEMKVVCQSFSNYPHYVKKLKENTLNNVNLYNNNRAFASNLITGDISLKNPKLLLLTIPYSNGWIAYIDDKPAKIYQANTMFMGIMVEAGNHKIRLEYKTPGLKTGFILSMMVLIFLIIYKGFKIKIN